MTVIKIRLRLKKKKISVLFFQLFFFLNHKASSSFLFFRKMYFAMVDADSVYVCVRAYLYYEVNMYLRLQLVSNYIS